MSNNPQKKLSDYSSTTKNPRKLTTLDEDLPIFGVDVSFVILAAVFGHDYNNNLFCKVAHVSAEDI